MLDAKMAELQQVVDPEDFASESIDIDIDVDEVAEVAPAEEVVVQEIPLEDALEDVAEENVAAEEVVEEAVVEDAEKIETEVVEKEEDDDDLPFAETAAEAPVETLTELSAEDDLPEAIEEPVAAEAAEPEDMPAEIEDDDLPGIFGEPETVTVAAKAKSAAKPTVNDMMAADCAWRKDMPGAPVRDIRSAISLNDRVIFINLLFDEDAQAFVNALTQINNMETLDQAVEYLTSTFPAWDMNYELVYRIMMAVRRKER